MVREKGWGKVVRELWTDIRAAERAKLADPIGTGIKNGLARLMPEYRVAEFYAPVHKLVEYGIFMTLGNEAINMIINTYLGVRAKLEAAEPAEPIRTEEDAREAHAKMLEKYL